MLFLSNSVSAVQLIVLLNIKCYIHPPEEQLLSVAWNANNTSWKNQLVSYESWFRPIRPMTAESQIWPTRASVCSVSISQDWTGASSWTDSAVWSLSSCHIWLYLLCHWCSGTWFRYLDLVCSSQCIQASVFKLCLNQIIDSSCPWHWWIDAWFRAAKEYQNKILVQKQFSVQNFTINYKEIACKMTFLTLVSV